VISRSAFDDAIIAQGTQPEKVTQVPVPIPASVAEKSKRASARATDAPLLTAERERWKQSDHLRLFRRVVLRAASIPVK
jgi:hypothetical protein